MAFGEYWLINVALRFTSNAMRGFMDTGNAARVAAGKIDTATAAMQRFEASTVAAGTRIAGAFALIGGAVSVYGIMQAAKFQLAMQNVFLATHANLSQQKQLSDLAMHMSGVTAQSALTMAEEQAALATIGFSKGQILKGFPLVAKAADVMMLSPKHLDPVQAASQMAQLIHLFGVYQGPKFDELMDRVVRLMYTQPEALTRLITQGRYMIPTSVAAGMSVDEIMDQAMIMGQTGLLRSKGGTGLADFIQRTYVQSLSSPMTGPQRWGLKKLGIFDSQGRNRFIDSKGNFMTEAAEGHIMGLGVAMHDKGQQATFLTYLFKALGQQAERFAATVTMPGVYARMAVMRKRSAEMAPYGQMIETAWRELMDTVIGKWRYFLTNLQNVFQNIMTPVLPTIIYWLNEFGGALSKLNDFLLANPGIAGAIGGTVLSLSAIAGIRVALGMLYKLGAMGLGEGIAASIVKFGIMGTGFRFIDNLLLAGMGARLLGLGKAILGLQVSTSAATAINALAGSIKAVTLTPLLAFLGRFALLRGALGLTRAIPGFGWVIAIAAAFALIVRIVEEKWHLTAYKVGYAFGYGMAMIADTFMKTLTWFFSALQSAIKTVFSHPGSLIGVGDSPLTILNKALQQAEQGRSGAAAGWRGYNLHHGHALTHPAEGGGFTDYKKPVHLTQNFTIHTSGTTEQQAQAIARLALANISSSIQSRGDTSFTTHNTPPVMAMPGPGMTMGA